LILPSPAGRFCATLRPRLWPRATCAHYREKLMTVFFAIFGGIAVFASVALLIARSGKG